METLFNDLIKFLTRIKVLIETLGLLGGFIIIFLTYKSVDMSRKSLEMTEKSVELLHDQVQVMNEQIKLEKEHVSPSWNFDFLGRSRIKISNGTPDCKLNYFTFYFKSDTLHTAPDYPVDYIFEIDSLTDIVKKSLYEIISNDIDYRQYEARIPFALEINYSYKGQSITDYGVWLLMFKINWEDTIEGTAINIKAENVEAYRYYYKPDSVEACMPRNNPNPKFLVVMLKTGINCNFSRNNSWHLRFNS